MSMEEAIYQRAEEQAMVFNVLADPTRLKLVKLLLRQPKPDAPCRQHHPDALCVNALAGLLGVTQSAVSQHLRVLKAIGLVKGERRGYHIHYHINPNTLERYRNLISAALRIEEPGGEQEPIPALKRRNDP